MRLAPLVLLSVLFSSCASAPSDDASLKAAASIYPLAYFAERVGGDSVSVHQIVPGGVEPHEFEPSPRDVAAIMEADVLILNGGGIDDWAEKLVPDFTAKGGTVVRMSDEIEMIHAEETEEEHSEHE